MTKAQLIGLITSLIYNNVTKDITGNILQGLLVDIVDNCFNDTNQVVEDVTLVGTLMTILYTDGSTQTYTVSGGGPGVTIVQNTGTSPSDVMSQDAVTNELNGIKADVTSLDGRVTTNETDITSLNTRVTTNATDIFNLDSRVTTNEGDITNLDNRVTTAEGSITTNTTDISNLTTRVTTAETNITGLTTDVQNVQGDLTLIHSRVDNLNLTNLKTSTAIAVGTNQGEYIVGDTIPIGTTLEEVITKILGVSAPPIGTYGMYFYNDIATNQAMGVDINSVPAVISDVQKGDTFTALCAATAHRFWLAIPSSLVDASTSIIYQEQWNTEIIGDFDTNLTNLTTSGGFFRYTVQIPDSLGLNPVNYEVFFWNASPGYPLAWGSTTHFNITI